LASNEVKIIGHKQKVELLPILTCDKSHFARLLTAIYLKMKASGLFSVAGTGYEEREHILYAARVIHNVRGKQKRKKYEC